MIPRPHYLERLLDLRDRDMVKVLTGVRRSGKSSLLKLLKTQLVSEGYLEEDFIEINFELPRYLEYQNPQEFYSYIKERIEVQAATYLFVDEVQEIDEWAKIINGIRAEFDIDIYVTGSNSRMFAGEHLTYLSGRYYRIEVFPLSFAEYLSFRGVEEAEMLGHPNIEHFYESYVAHGSFPAVALADKPAITESILEGLFESVFTRDILLRGNIRNEVAFMRVARFALDNIGNQTSANSIANTLKCSGYSITSDTVDGYLSLMKNAYLLYQCNRYDIRGKEHLRSNGKYYVVDTGLKNRVLGHDNSNRGHVTENLVFLELLRRGYEVSVGTFARIQAEIDFVVVKQNERFYIQVCESVMDEAIFERETRPFALLEDGYPRILITKDSIDYSTGDVRHMNFYNFLLGTDEVL